jgi:hypothetical protein
MTLPRAMLVRDAALAGLALGAWALDAEVRASIGLAATAVGVGAGALAALVGYLAHEWGHLAGARLGGSVVHLPDSAGSVFLFKFDVDRNGPRQFVWMSLGGFAASALVVALYLAVLPLDALAGRVAILLTALGVLATLVLELPPFFRVLRGGELPRGPAYRSSSTHTGS